MRAQSVDNATSGQSITWLLGPYADPLLFIAIPLAAFPAYRALAALLSFTFLKLAVLSVSATGHHLPGFIRAYTDRSVFEKFRVRLLVVPTLFILLAGMAAWYRLSVVFFLLIVWSVWHGGMQIMGFLRIYDAKSGLRSALWARLDFWMCLAWFVQVVLWAVPKKTSVLSSFYVAGGPLLPLPWALGFGKAWLALTALVTAGYVIALAADALGGRRPNPMKLACLAGSIGFWAFCLLRIDNLLIGLLLWEVFHDMQYNAFVWKYNRRRVERGLSGSRLERFLFAPGWQRLAVYAGCIAAYGCVGLLTQDVLNAYGTGHGYQAMFSRIGNVFAASTLIHFYMDGFIWRVRDGKVQADLGVAGTQGAAAAGGYQDRNEARHWVFVSLLFAGCGLLAASEHFGWTAGAARRQADSLADLVPASGYANFIKASHLKTEGRGDSASWYYGRAIARDSAYGFAHAYIADLKAEAGDVGGAAAEYALALERDPESDLLRENLAALSGKSGDYARARGLYLELAARDTANAGFAFGAAFASLQMKKGLEAKPWLEKTLRLDPNRPDALTYLGMVHQALGHADSARACYLGALALDSADSLARANLATLP